MKRIGLALVVALAGCRSLPPSDAGSGVQRFTYSDGSYVEVTRAAAHRNGDIVRVPLHANFNPPRSVPLLKGDGLMDMSIALYEFDCAKRKQRVIDFTAFQSGTRLDIPRRADLEWRDVTGGAAPFVAACGWILPATQ